MIDKNKAIEAIYAAIDELNAQLPADQHLQKSADTNLTGEKSPLDSLGLINLLVAIEQEISKLHGKDVQLLDENLLGEEGGPYRTVETLADYTAQSA
jgi:acyl carrier protein